LFVAWIDDVSGAAKAFIPELDALSQQKTALED
jgi:hypothetical protein